MSLDAFIPATWRGTTAVRHVESDLGLSFDQQAGGPIRLLVPLDSARQAAESILDAVAAHERLGRTNSHSDKSSGSPSVEGSIPEGHGV